MLRITALADDRDEIVEVNVWVFFLEQSVSPSQIDAIWFDLMLEGSSRRVVIHAEILDTSAVFESPPDN
jgi:hypothetical protein